MHVIASFPFSTNVELALKKLEENGVLKNNIVAIPLKSIKNGDHILDTLYQSDGHGTLDLGFILGTIFMLLGAIYGFVLTWGPIIWGLIGLISGISLGFIIRYLYIKRKNKLYLPKEQKTEVILIIRCSEQQIPMINQILINHRAIGLGELQK
ncbi:hypothetical protein [Salinibacillus xinjiangensis]|uniref:Uncharacterized protein n=1 Tax=Salinibacillus xinjiangensis TaxID=1229268 RepID=A0A6G1X7T5_9BACI|nr:hypothetical protein [Salinibacillus xinjiangensis]MRG86868.1 hypothetical protein [Salinibacillus xinjiangensis]